MTTINRKSKPRITDMIIIHNATLTVGGESTNTEYTYVGEISSMDSKLSPIMDAVPSVLTTKMSLRPAIFSEKYA